MILGRRNKNLRPFHIIAIIDESIKACYNYDDGGNLSEKKEYDYNLTDGKGALRKTINYTYYDGWKDRLKSYNGSQDIPYDVNGNPLKWFKHGTNGSTLELDLEWDSNNRLVKVTKGTNVIEYKYNSEGQRVQKISYEDLFLQMI
jgi:YD repeat-containing protein